ncbi:transporter substrate-binding domain-containing protein [Frankia canadensis]|nr:transporter substrate-binding domain-containing protein [Frankia canadensis]
MSGFARSGGAPVARGGAGAAAKATRAAVLALLIALAGCAAVPSPLPPQARPLGDAASPAGPSAGTGSTAPPCRLPAGSLRPAPVAPPGPSLAAAPGPTPGPSPDPDVAAVVRRGYLRVGVRSDAAPFGSLQPGTGRLEGFEVDVANQVGRALFGADGRVRLRPVTTAQAVELVRRGELDVAAAGVTVTCERSELVDFSAPYFVTAPAALLARTSSIRRLEDLRGHRTCAVAGAAAAADCLVTLQRGGVEAVTGDETTLVGLAAQDPATHVVGLAARRTDQVAMVVARSAPGLTRFVNAVLAARELDGAWGRSYTRWLRGTPPPAPAATYRD